MNGEDFYQVVDIND